MPTGPVEQQNSMRFSGNMPADLVKMHLHGVGISKRHRKRCTRAAPWANGAEQIHRFVALIGWQAWPGSPSCPDPRQAILLADPGFVLKPDVDALAAAKAAQVGFERVREVFLDILSISSSCWGCWGRPESRVNPSSFRSAPTWRSW